MEEAVITGLGIVSPIGVGRAAVWESLSARRSGVRPLEDLRAAGWPAPYGGRVVDFDAKQYVTPRKSVKVMAEEIQFAFAAAELAWSDAGLEDGAVDPERLGVVCGAGFVFSEFGELEAPYRAVVKAAEANGAAHPPGDGELDLKLWGAHAIREFFPLWMLKYLPNMSACHIGIRRDARGPNNTIISGEVSGLLALGEAVAAIRRGIADVMIVGGSSSRLHMADLSWRGRNNLAISDADPAEICRPFDAGRCGQVYGEGAAMLVVESAAHAQRRGARPLAKVLSVASRSEHAVATRRPTGASVAAALAGAMESAGIQTGEVGLVKAHGVSTVADDRAEAAAIRQVLGDAPVTALKGFFGNIDSAGGAVELATLLVSLAEGHVPATLNCTSLDPQCPVNIVTEPRAIGSPYVVAMNHNFYGQAAAAVLEIA